MDASRKPVRSGTSERLDVRLTLDPHMGDIFILLSNLPSRLRGRELLAFARQGLAVRSMGMERETGPSTAFPRTPADSTPPVARAECKDSSDRPPFPAELAELAFASPPAPVH